MKTTPLYLTASLLALSLLQACSDKTVNAPASASAAASAAVAAVPAVVAAPAPELVKNTKPISKGATMECADRKVVLESTCLEAVGDALLQCTRQTLAVSDNATEKVLNTRTFATQAPKGDVPALVEEKIAEMTCVTSKAGQKYIVTAMINGATCETCEWNEVYSWDGVLVGSDRDKKIKLPAVDEAVGAVADKDVDRVTGSNDMAGFYSEVPPKMKKP